MRDYDLERGDRPSRHPQPRDGAGADVAGGGHAGGLGRSPALDTASLLRLQRTAGNAGVVQMLGEDEAASPVHDVVGSGGSPLDAATRSTMEGAFGQSFEDVRVHTDDQASRSAESVGANAYTVGSDVVFRSGQYDPGSSSGQKTLAHELTHVVQQRSGPVDGTDAPGGIRVSDPSDRFEQAAESSAGAVMSAVQTSRSSSAAEAAVAQLEEDPSATPVVQREAAPEEEEEPEA